MQKNYVKVSKEEAEQVMTDIYRYMPLFIMVDCNMVRVVNQDSNNIYYTEEI